MMSMDTSKEKVRMQRKEKEKEKGKGKGKKGHGPQDQGKGQGDGKCEANYVNPSHSSQPSSQQAAGPSSLNASGFFATHSPVHLTSVKMTASGEQKMEPDFSGCAFLGQETSCSEGRRGGRSLSDATYSGNPRSWMYKSYGLKECSQCFL